MKIVNKETGIGNVQFKKVMCGKDKLSETKAEKKKRTIQTCQDSSAIQKATRKLFYSLKKHEQPVEVALLRKVSKIFMLMFFFFFFS